MQYPISSIKKASLGLMMMSLLLTGCVSVGSSDGGDARSSGPVGVFRSPIAGDEWENINTMPLRESIEDISRTNVYRLVQDPVIPAGVYWGSRQSGMFYSFDFGSTWQQPQGELSTGFIYDIEVSPHDPCTIFASEGKKVYRSIDCNRNFVNVYEESAAFCSNEADCAKIDIAKGLDKQQTNNDRIVSILADPFSPQRVYVIKRGGDLLRSEDGGISWQTIARFKNTQLVDIYADPKREGILYVTSQRKGLFRSDNGGSSWKSLASGLSTYEGALSYLDLKIYPKNPDVLYWVSHFGILRSNDRGTTWQVLPIIPSAGTVKIYSFAINPEDEKEIYFTATVADRSTFYKTIDGGENWITKRLPSNQLPTEMFVDWSNSERLFIGFTVPEKRKRTLGIPVE